MNAFCAFSNLTQYLAFLILGLNEIWKSFELQDENNIYRFNRPARLRNSKNHEFEY